MKKILLISFLLLINLNLILFFYFYQNKNLIKQKKIIENIVWKKEVKGVYKDKKITISLEIHQSLCQGKKCFILVENANKFEVIGNAVCWLVNILDNKIKQNVILDPDKNKYQVIYFIPNWQIAEFNEEKRVRIIYFDHNYFKFTLPRDYPYFSYGWGVHPKTKELIIFLSHQRPKPDSFFYLLYLAIEKMAYYHIDKNISEKEFINTYGKELYEIMTQGLSKNLQNEKDPIKKSVFNGILIETNLRKK